MQDLAFHLKRDKHAEVDLPGFKNLEGLSRVKLITQDLTLSCWNGGNHNRGRAARYNRQ